MAALIVLSTFPEIETARKITLALVEEQLAACANLLPAVESTYWWKGVIETSAEVLAVIKTTEERYPQLEARIKAMHPYEVPEVVAIPVSGGSAEYLQWVAASCAV